MQVIITNKMRQQLKDLGYSTKDVRSMLPQDAFDIINSGITKGKVEQAAERREKILDQYEEQTLTALQKAKKHLDRFKKDLEASQKLRDETAELLEDIEDNIEDNPDYTSKLEEFHTSVLDQRIKYILSLEDRIAAQENLIKRISLSEDGLVDDLQELNDAVVVTPSPDDDKVLEDLVREKIEDLEAIEEARTKLDKAQREAERARKRLQDATSRKENLIKGPFDLKLLNEVDDELGQAEIAYDNASRAENALLHSIMRHENSLRDKQTRERILEIQKAVDEAHKPLPEFQKIQEESKKEIKEEEPSGQEEAAKVKFYKDQSEAMKVFSSKVEEGFSDFITGTLSPDIPVDDKVEKSIRLFNAAVLKRVKDMYEQAKVYRRNDMHRSSILLLPALYEILVRNMDAVLDEEASKKEAQAIFLELIESNLLKEAISFHDMMEGAKGLGSKVTDVGRRGLDKAKEIGEKAKKSLELRRFRKEDTGPRRDFEPHVQVRKNLDFIRGLERQRANLRDQAAQLLSVSEDPAEMRRLKDVIRSLDEDLRDIGEKKNLIEEGLSHEPHPGMMEGLEQGAQAPRSDQQRAVAIMAEIRPELLKYFSLLPNDESLEIILLNHSDKIRGLADNLIKIAYSHKDRYPNLPLTISAYAHLFLALDDAFDRALRSKKVQA
jgi:hypothetical protein